MFTLVIVLAIISSILLILIVLIQNPKGGGIAANFSAANQIAGVKKTNDFIEKATWTLAISLLLFSMSSGYLYKSGGSQDSIMQEQLENAPTGIPGIGGASDFAPADGTNPALTPEEPTDQ